MHDVLPVHQQVPPESDISFPTQKSKETVYRCVMQNSYFFQFRQINKFIYSILQEILL